MAANNIYIQVDFNSQNAQQNVNALNQGIQNIGPTAEKSGKQATTALQSVQVSVQQTTRVFGELTAALAGLGIGRMVGSIVQVSAELGRAQQFMEAFTGSAEAAEAVFEQIRAIAAQSPFRFKDLEETGRRLLAFGMAAKDVPVTLKIISDQVTAMGGSIENVNSIVGIFGRVMNKDFVGAMDLMRLLPAQGVKVMDALRDSLSKQLGTTVDTEQVKRFIKEGVLDPMETLRVMLRQMQSQSAGAGERVNDAAKAFKNLGDQLIYAEEQLAGDKGFGPALAYLAQEIQGLLAPLAGLIDALQKLPEDTKERIVEIAALGAAVTALGTALSLFAAVASPLFKMVGVLGGLGATIAEMNPVLATAAIAIAAVGFGLYKLSEQKDQVGALKDIFQPPEPDAIDKWVAGKLGIKLPSGAEAKQKVKDFVGGIIADIKSTMGGLAIEGQAWIKKFMDQVNQAAEAFAKGTGKAAKENTDESLEALRTKLSEWSDAAGKTLLQALSSPVEAVALKYRDLFDKLEVMIRDKVITGAAADDARVQLVTARSLEMEAKAFEKEKQHIAERGKLEVERIKGSYEAQIAYIEALDEQDLRKKVAGIDRITELRIQSADEVAKQENVALQQNFEAQKTLLEGHRDLFESLGVDVTQAVKKLQDDTREKQKYNTEKATYDEQKIRLEGWKKANDAIIEDQKRVFEAFKSEFDEIFDAFTSKTKSIGQALGDVFKKLALGEVRNIFSSQMAAAATELAGYGRPSPEITSRGGGILSQLFQRGMPPRPPGPPPEAYTPTQVTSGVSPVQASANRIADAASLYDSSAVVFSNAVDRFNNATVQTTGHASRMAEATGTITEAGAAIEEASAATGVSTDLLRSMIGVESGFHQFAVSKKGAMGYMQLMPGTAASMGLPKSQIFDASKNIMAGAKYYKQLLDKYGGDETLALTAYNWGEGNLDRAIRTGAQIPQSVQKYVQMVQTQMPTTPLLQATRAFQPPEGFGFGQTPGIESLARAAAGGLPEQPDLTSATTAPTPTELEQAKQLGVLAQIAAPILKRAGITTAGGGQGLKIPTPSQLGQFFGISPGLTSPLSILTSPAAGTAALMGGMALVSRGLQQRNAPATTLGGGLAGAGYFLTNPALIARTSEMAGGVPAGLGAGVAAGAGLGLFASGFQRGGAAGLGMSVGGGALAGAGIGFMVGGPLGAAIGAGVGAAAGLISGVVRLFVQTEQERIRSQIKQVYGIDISNRQILTQIQQIVDQNYGGSVSVGIRSQEVQNLVRLYALSTGQAANMPRPMYAATIAQSTQGLQMQPVYQGGVLVQNPYTGPTTYQYQTAVTAAQGLRAGTSLGVPGASGIITSQWQQLMLQTIQGNPSAIAMANSSAASAGDSRLTTTQAMQEPLTALS